jgi:hypothetical protein
MDTTRLDVFAFDPFTLKWVNAELTVSMHWYDRCIAGCGSPPYRPRPSMPPPCSTSRSGHVGPRRTGRGMRSGQSTASRARC